ncbi:MAG: hypothetical protein E7268_03590 [Lachnospiraceae bacterium]|nr:hypothetical protein [Lachnospiraceae bacterium]
MKNKSTLVMIEYIVMLLVFVLSTTVCIRMFVLSEQLSRKYEATDRAVLVAQNIAEGMKTHGIEDFFSEEKTVQTAENTGCVFYDKNWKVTEEATAEFVAEVNWKETGLLFRAEIIVSKAKGTELFRLPVAGQKETEVAMNETN